MEQGMNYLQLQGQGQGLHQIRGGGPTGFENPNYHGSGTSSLFNHHNPPPPYESYELGPMTGGRPSSDKVAEVTNPSAVGVTVPTKPEAPYYYQVSTPNYMLLIGGR